MRPAREPALRRSAGFTLIELLVALILLSFVFLLLTSGLQFGTKIWSAREEKTGDTSEVLAVQDILRGVLSEIRPIMIEADQTTSRHVFFVGSEDAIRFAGSIPGHFGVGGIYEVGVYLAQGDNGINRIELSWRLFRPATASSEPAMQEQRVVLVDNVSEVQFSYFGYLGQNQPAQWYDEWQNLQYLPQLIRMHVSLSQGDQTWPDLVVAPMARSMIVTVEPE